MTDSEAGVDPLETLRAVWSNESTSPFDGWLRSLSAAFFASSLDLEAAARFVGATAAELDAALRLATLDDESLAALAAGTAPPRTTWYAFAGASPQGVRAGIAALRDLRPTETAGTAVETAVHVAEGPTPLERVAALRGEVFGHLAHKAKHYGLLTPNARKFLVDIAIRKNGGKTLTEKQAAFALSVLTQLVEGGAVTADSSDQDQEICDEVLGALGQPDA